MKAEAILNLLPDTLLKDLSMELGTDKYSKKLEGHILFKLLLYSILSNKDNSLRKMAMTYESIVFQVLLGNGITKERISHGALSDRIGQIDYRYFEELYHQSVSLYGHLFNDKDREYTIYDSTIVSFSSLLLKEGYHIAGRDTNHINQLKFTVGYSLIPNSIQFYNDKKYTSENVALKEAILSEKSNEANTIRIFDRGINSRITFEYFSSNNIGFVTRLNTKYKHQIVESNQLNQPIETSTLIIYSDSIIYLFSADKKIEVPLRCIESEHKKSKEKLVFLTNLMSHDPLHITELYKKRWQIESFFKFLKQELNFSHIASRNENGIKVMMYITMIASILLIAYKKSNNLKGYKIVKQKFLQEIERLIIKDIVVLCNGDPHIFDNHFKPPD